MYSTLESVRKMEGSLAPEEWIQPPLLPGAWVHNKINYLRGIRAPFAIEVGFVASAVLALFGALYFSMWLIVEAGAGVVVILVILAAIGAIADKTKKVR